MKTIKITIEFLDTFDTTIKSTMLEKIAQFKANGDLAFENNKRIKEGILDKMIDPIRKSLNVGLGEDLWIRPTTFKYITLGANTTFQTEFVLPFASKISVIVGVKIHKEHLGNMTYKVFDAEPFIRIKRNVGSTHYYDEVSIGELSQVHQLCEQDYLQYFINNSN